MSELSLFGPDPAPAADVTPFVFESQPVRVIEDDHGEPWFVLADVCDALGLARRPAAVAERLADDEKGVRQTYTLGGPQNVITVSEAGLYVVILRSDSPKAEPFRRWVTHDVLPSIRRRGAYLTPRTVEEVLTDPDFLIRLATELKTEKSRRLDAETKIAELEPPARAWTNLATSGGDYSVGDAAKVLSRDPAISIGQNRLFTWMETHGWTFRGHDGRPHPHQAKVDQGLLVAKINAPYWSQKHNDLVTPAPTIRITPKGLDRMWRELGGMEALTEGAVA